jgi:hypothetical protein
MKLVVFTDQIPGVSDNALIAKFENKGYRVAVDSIHKHETNWIIENYGSCPHRVYFADHNELYDGIVKELDPHAPFSFIAYFSEKQIINNADWVYIRLFIKSLLYDAKMPRLTRRMSLLLQDEHVEIQALPPIIESSEEKEPCYSFKKSIFEDRNIALCEIIKPIIVKCQDKQKEAQIIEQSVPYTVVIRNYASRGFYPVFWSLFICESWGKDNRDIQFLKALWSNMEMKGEFDMDKIISDGVEECNWGTENGGCSGPEVYRKSLQDTLITLQSKERGFAQ